MPPSSYVNAVSSGAITSSIVTTSSSNAEFGKRNCQKIHLLQDTQTTLIESIFFQGHSGVLDLGTGPRA